VQTKNKVESGFLLDVVVRKSASVFEFPSLSLASEELPARVIVLPVRVFVIPADEEQGGEWIPFGCCSPKECVRL